MADTAVEIAVQGTDGVRIAIDEGADRIELCSALDATGGLTPSAGLIEAAAELGRDAGLDGFVNVLVRPRAGDFVYRRDELDLMLRDIRLLPGLGAGGIVIGALDSTGGINQSAVGSLAAAAEGLTVTFHRAIDVLRDPVRSLEALAEAGVQRILTSGGAQATVDGLDTLARLVQASAGRIEIMAGGGVRVPDIPALLAAGVDAVHLSAKRPVVGGRSGPGGGASRYFTTDAAIVRAAVAAVHTRAIPADR